jgi:Leucine-rich repeat (LRR) protein
MDEEFERCYPPPDLTHRNNGGGVAKECPERGPKHAEDSGVLSISTLSHVDISSLDGFLSSLPLLTSLDGNDYCEPADVPKLAKVLASQFSNRISVLRLEGLQSFAGSAEFSQALSRSHVAILSLHSTPLSPRAVELLFCNPLSLTHLDLSNTSIQSVRALGKCIQTSPCFQENLSFLNVSNNPLDSSEKSNLVDALVCCKALRRYGFFYFKSKPVPTVLTAF